MGAIALAPAEPHGRAIAPADILNSQNLTPRFPRPTGVLGAEVDYLTYVLITYSKQSLFCYKNSHAFINFYQKR